MHVFVVVAPSTPATSADAETAEEVHGCLTLFCLFLENKSDEDKTRDLLTWEEELYDRPQRGACLGSDDLTGQRGEKWGWELAMVH